MEFIESQNQQICSKWSEAGGRNGLVKHLPCHTKLPLSLLQSHHPSLFYTSEFWDYTICTSVSCSCTMFSHFGILEWWGSLHISPFLHFSTDLQRWNRYVFSHTRQLHCTTYRHLSGQSHSRYINVCPLHKCSVTVDLIAFHFLSSQSVDCSFTIQGLAKSLQHYITFKEGTDLWGLIQFCMDSAKPCPEIQVQAVIQ